MNELLMKKLRFLISTVCIVSISSCFLVSSRVEAQNDQSAFWTETRTLGDRLSEQFQSEQYLETIAKTTELISKLESRFGSYSSVVLSLRSFLAKVYEEAGDRDQALTVLADTIEKRETIFGSDRPEVIESLKDLGLRYWQNGDYAEALQFFERSFTLPGTDYSTNAFGRSTGSESLDALSQAEQDYAATLSAADRSVLIYRALLDEKQIRTAVKLAETEDAYISAHLQNTPTETEAESLALSFILRYKGYLLDKTANISQQLWQPPTPDVQNRYEELRALRDILQTLSMTDTSEISAEQYVTEVSKLENKAAEISLQLSSQNVAEQAFAPIPIDAVQQAIPANAALIELVHYQPTNADGSKRPAAHYAAYVLTRQGIAGAVDLGEAATIDELAVKLRQSLAAQSGSVKEPARQLYQKLIAPLDNALSGKTQLIISPDSQLNLIPFEVLVDQQNRYLVESQQISYVTSGRELLRLRDSRPSRQKSVIIANPDYDSAISSNSISSVDSSSLYAINNMPTFSPLPGTAIEASALAPLLPDASVLTGSAATKDQLNRLQGPRLLHIATHGFFLSDAIAPTPNSFNRGASFDLVDTESPISIDLEDSASPLYNSGLALAGANTKATGGEDGILTAMEASGLNLQGTQLVVLSACETGVGAASDGEGVYGLRRAFAIAGAESQLMSLWQVDDYGTSELMQLYYKNLMTKGQGRSEALRNAQLELLNTGTYAHPYYWSAFIFSGDWRSLE